MSTSLIALVVLVVATRASVAAAASTVMTTTTAAPQPRTVSATPGSRRVQQLWNQTTTTARATKRKVMGGLGRLPGLRRGVGGMGGSGDSSSGPSMQDTINGLVARSWEFLLDEKRWGAPVIDGDDGQVWKYWMPKDAYGAANSVVKAKGVVRASPEEIFDMIFDSSRTKEYNKYSVGRTDIATYSPTSKVVWNRTNPPGTKKQHDFCTLMHGVPFAKGNGTYLLMTTAVEHPKAKPSSNYLRSEILLGVNLMKPVPGKPGYTELTTVNHVKTTGVPAFLSEKVAARSAIDFIRKVDEVLGGPTTAAAAATAAAVATSATEDASGEKPAAGLQREAAAVVGVSSSSSGTRKRGIVSLRRVDVEWGSES